MTLPITPKNFPINTGSRRFSPGEIIVGLSLVEEQALVAEGHAENLLVIHEEAETAGPNEWEVSTEAVNLEQFQGLKAAEQKSLLQSLGFEPAANAEQRLEQYSQWLEEQRGDEDGDSPQTGFPV
ncbi:hypothetical protein [Paenibacillus ehimensis]|uniref:hypothetical protein n=1 Tax=Paenibacillus ehimensis TaxID=79264 RepID=UPI0004725458|nr:hypothetical protein [Paenibacillus ehimensis]